MIGPMALSGLAHLLGWTDFQLPPELIAVAQVVLGVHIGTRFIGAHVPSLVRLVGPAVASVVMHLTIAALAALAVAHLTGFEFFALLMAYAPGGVTEMSLMAIAAGIDVAFVATHHLIRMVAVMVVGPSIFALTLGSPTTKSAPRAGKK